MRYLVTIFALSAVGTVVSATCYKSGDGGNKATANDNIDTACKGMQGYYKPQQFRTACLSKESDSTYWFLEVKQTGWGGTLEYDACVKGLKREINGCSKGGSSADGTWNYRADPGQGSCKDIGYINKHPRKRQVVGNARNESDVDIVFGGPPLALTHG